MDPSSHPPKLSLSDLPPEIKKHIIQYVVMQTKKRPCSNAHKPLPLCLVNREFYELCSPLNWHELDLLFQDPHGLEKLIQKSLPRQHNHVQSIIIGLHESGSPEEQLIRILEICNNATKLSLRAETSRLNDLGSFIIDPMLPTSALLEPISRLSHVTYLTLHNYTSGEMFSEEFVVKLIKNMVHLAYLRTDRVQATHQTCDFCQCPDFVQRNLSPLAVQLASLSSLKFLHFSYMDCFDSGWSKIEWKGALEGFTLRKTAASLRAVHAFCSLFQDSLVYLTLYGAPFCMAQHPDEIANSDVFRLPKLKRLSFCSVYMIQILLLFRGCRNIFRISLMSLGDLGISLEEIKCLINRDEPVWIHLKSLLVHMEKGSLSRQERASLIRNGLKAGVKVECGTLKKVRQPFFEDDGFSTEGGTSNSSSDAEINVGSDEESDSSI